MKSVFAFKRQKLRNRVNTPHFKNRLTTLMEKHDVSTGAIGFSHDWQRKFIWATKS